VPEPPARSDSGGAFYFDTVTLSNFALVGRTGLLVERYGSRARVTPQVLDELLEGVTAGYEALQSIVRAVADGGLGSAGELSPDERTLQGQLLRNLGAGEVSVVACAKFRAGVAVTDDRAARGICQERGVPFTGTIGILLASTRDGSLSALDADAILDAMVRAGYFSPVRRISDLL
jgi:predicted nucleic acid-binding protein